MENEEQKDLLMSQDFAEVENSPLWREEEMWVGITLNAEQFETFKHGYKPDWECRYEPHFINGNIYISRSGIWVKKYIVKRQFEGTEHECYDIDTAYSTEREYGRPLLAEVLAEGYFEPRIWEREDAVAWFELFEMVKNAKPMPVIEVIRKPRKCKICGSNRIKRIIYGMPLGYDPEKEVIGGCVTTSEDSNWICGDCGQNYRSKILKRLR